MVHLFGVWIEQEAEEEAEAARGAFVWCLDLITLSTKKIPNIKI